MQDHAVQASFVVFTPLLKRGVWVAIEPLRTMTIGLSFLTRERRFRMEFSLSKSPPCLSLQFSKAIVVEHVSLLNRVFPACFWRSSFALCMKSSWPF